jgi:hypothetical protein
VVALGFVGVGIELISGSSSPPSLSCYCRSTQSAPQLSYSLHLSPKRRTYSQITT